MVFLNRMVFIAASILVTASFLLAEDPAPQPLLQNPRAIESGPHGPHGVTDQESDLYRQGTQALQASQWDTALAAFSQVIDLRGPNADGAYYWKAYSLNREGKHQDALDTLLTLQNTYARSLWNFDARALQVEIRQSMGQDVSPDNVSDEDLKLIAINGLMRSDPARALPMLKKIIQSDQPQRVKGRALFVLAQSNSPEARAFILSIARGESDKSLQQQALQDVMLFGDRLGRNDLAGISASSDDVAVKRTILRGYMMTGDKDQLLAAAKAEKNPAVQFEAVRQLGVMGAGNELWQLYESTSDLPMKHEIIRSLMVGAQTEKLTAVAKTEKDPNLRREAVRSLGMMGLRTSDTLTSLLQTETAPGVRRAIVNAFFLQGNSKALIEIARSDKYPDLRHLAVEKLSLMNSDDSTKFMMELLAR